jgi:DNA topoisomerase I
VIEILTMSKTLVVLESPNKEKKVQEYLGEKFLVTSSKGHIRDLDAKSLSIDIESDFAPKYFVNEDKQYVINNLKRQFKQCTDILLATDYDREGESIAWHVAEVLGIPESNRKRLLFQEITKKALQKSLGETKDLDMNMFYAQQARRIIDRLIGYKWLSPLLWKNVQSSMKKGASLSGGRVQSVVNRLIIDREREIKKFEQSPYFKTIGHFKDIDMDLDHKFTNAEEVETFIDVVANSTFLVENVKNKKTQRKPSTPFITSTLQQEASNKWRMSPKSTMSNAQRLYENGLITYMRTDSVTISDEILDKIKNKVVSDYGSKYSNKTQYKNKSQNSQEAHEAIRPSDINKFEIKRDDSLNLCDNCVKLYNLIWRRTIASQMSPAQVNIQTITAKMTTIDEDDETDETKKMREYKFVTKNDTIEFDGFLRVYRPIETKDAEESDDEKSNSTSKKREFKNDETLELLKLNSDEKYTKPSVGRFTEASLVKKLDDMGIGRPSTYSSMVSIVQDRNFAEKRDIKGLELESRKYSFDAVCCELDEKTEKSTINGEKGKLVPTDIGNIVNTYLEDNIGDIVNYDFTVNLEKFLDEISSGTKVWTEVVRYIYDTFEPTYLELNAANILEKDKHKRTLGNDPTTGRDIVAYIGQYGPVVCLNGDVKKKIKNKYVSIKSDKYTIDTITLDDALELIKYPYEFGDYKGSSIEINQGKFGLYFKYKGKNYSLKDFEEPQTIEDFDDYFKALEERKNSNGNRILDGNTIEGLPRKISDKIWIKVGKYGPYIQYKKNPISDTKPKFIPLKGNVDLLKITEKECMALINKNKK